MLYIPWMIILGGHDIKKKSFENFDFELPRVKNCISRLCTNPLGDPPNPPAQYPNRVKTRKYGLKHALHTLDDHFG